MGKKRPMIFVGFRGPKLPKSYFSLLCSSLPWRVRGRPDILLLRGDPGHSQPLQGEPALLCRQEDLRVGEHPGGADLPQRGLEM